MGLPGNPLQLGIEEFQIEARIVDDQRRLAEEFQKRVRDLGEARLVGEKRAGDAVHAFGFRRHVAFGIEIGLKRAPGGKMIDQLDAADLDDAVAVGRIESGGLGVENDFTKVVQLVRPFACAALPERRDDLFHLVESVIEAFVGFNHEIGFCTLFRVRAPGGRECPQAVRWSSLRATEPARAAHPRRGNHHHGIHARVPARFKQKRNIQHDKLRPLGLRLLDEGALGVRRQRMDDGLQLWRRPSGSPLELARECRRARRGRP